MSMILISTLITTLITTNWITICAYILLFDRSKRLLRDLKNEKLNNQQMSDYINSKENITPIKAIEEAVNVE